MNKLAQHWLLPLRLGLSMLKKNRMRSVLTAFGILIGIAMVIVVLSAGEGLKSLILGEVASFGDNWINIEVKVPSASKNSQENANALASGVMVTTLTEDDFEALQELPNIDGGYAGITTQAVAARGTEKKRPTIFGVSPSYIDVSKDVVEDGRFFDDNENAAAANVVVLGSDIKESLFGNDEAVGAYIKIGGKNMQVVGVMEPLGASGFMNMDEIVYLPVQTVQKKLMGVRHVLWVVVQTVDTERAEDTAEEIRAVLRDRHDISNPEKEDFAVTTMAEALALVDAIILGITALLIVLVMISLVVGGVGIMNVMYVSVAERTFEIGLRKAVGATEGAIQRQFLLEAVVLTLFGGVVGILLGIFLSYIVAIGAQFGGLNWEFRISLASMILSVSFSVIVGVFFGWYPAKKAAQMDPIAALRNE